MASVQERLQIGRVPLDKWSTREQLCLASAVSCSGDQNWMSVSRTLKVLCGSSRPADWFSQKSCAVQYGHLLENVETTKRKKRSSDSGSNSPTAGETPTDLILKRLAEERMQELKTEIRKSQEEFAKIHSELKSLQSGQLEEEDILEMWREIEKEQEMQRIEEMKMENQLREREQQKQEMQRTWRPNAPTALASNFPQVVDDKQTDVSLEEIIGSNKQIMSGSQPQATSPLLSSLLKSPTSGGSTPLATTGHNSAPTITTLLTGGAINANQPAIVLKNTIPASEAVHLLTRPISGPPSDSVSPSTNPAQTLLSPSQSAPTLSLLLEKTKVPSTSSSTSISTVQDTLVPAASSVEPLTKSKASNLVSDSNNEEVPMDIEEDVVEGTVSTPDMIGTGDSDADTNEEQQLLEVFKNIGNIDELADIDVAAVIDEEVDFLKSVSDEPTDLVEEMDFDGKSTAEESLADNSDKLSKNRINKEKSENSSEMVKEIKAETTGDIKTAGTEKDILKPEIISSDDSNDNVPLATLGSSSNMLENKDTINTNSENESSKEIDSHFEGKIEIAEQSEESNTLTSSDKITSRNNVEDEVEDATSCETILKDPVGKRNGPQKSPESESSDVIIIPTDDESNSDKQQSEKVYDEKANISINIKDLSDVIENKTNDKEDICETIDDTNESSRTLSKDAKDASTPSATILLGDTDEESSTTDASVSNKNEEKTKYDNSKINLQNKKVNAEGKAESKIEDETTTNQTPVKPPVIRKLRERDRSESPLPTLDDDTTASDQSAQRSRRRYSSTPIIDSIPNSPASSDRDDRDVRISKKSLMNLYNTITTLKHASAVQTAISENTSKFKEICNRPMDFQIMKRNIENGSIRSVHELQRDILLLCQNALMVFQTNSSDYKMVYEFIKDCQSLKEFISNGNLNNIYKSEKEKETRASTSHSSSPYPSGIKVRGSSRKSQRIS